MTKYREFWIRQDGHFPEGNVHEGSEQVLVDSIQVVEMGALTDLMAECEKLKETLEFYSGYYDWSLDWRYVNKPNVDTDEGFCAKQALASYAEYKKDL